VDDDDFFVSPSSSPVPTLRNAAVPIAVAKAAVSAAVSSQSAAAAAVNRWAPKAMVHFDWGQRHPDYNKQVKRATWSIEEKAWILAWIKAHPDQVTGHARCLKDIQADAGARAIFHSIHVLDGARLRAGFEAAVKCSAVKV
jgi:hypothetical protein